MNQLRSNKKTIVLYTDEKETINKLKKHKRSFRIVPHHHWYGEQRFVIGADFWYDIKYKKWLERIIK